MSVDAARAGYDVYMHTLGDRAVSLGLDAAEAVRKAGFNETHITLSHAQLVAEKDFPRFKAADVFINSTGGWWYYFDEEAEEAALGDRTNQEYPYRYMIDDGVLFVQGSDFPADPRINPFVHIEGSVTRHYYEFPQSSKIKNPTNRLSVKEAVESYTINGAKLLRMEDDIGSVEVGKLADLIVVDQNIMEIDPKQIHRTRVLMTMMDGKVWHDVVFGWGDSKDDIVPDADGLLPSPVPDEHRGH
jgi:predicted amidohydrolase YtcJ